MNLIRVGSYGVLPILVAPFDGKGEVDLPSLKNDNYFHENSHIFCPGKSIDEMTSSALVNLRNNNLQHFTITEPLNL